MLRLTAEHGDMWNTAWFGRPSEAFHGRVADLKAACEEVGRDFATIAITVGVMVAFPEIEAIDENLNTPERTIQGSPEEIAAVFKEYEALGAKHLICLSMPDDRRGLTELTKALNAYRAL